MLFVDRPRQIETLFTWIVRRAFNAIYLKEIKLELNSLFKFLRNRKLLLKTRKLTLYIRQCRTAIMFGISRLIRLVTLVLLFYIFGGRGMGCFS